MEVGGLFGSLLAGRLSDFLVDKYPNDGAVGKRVQVGAPCRRHCRPSLAYHSFRLIEAVQRQKRLHSSRDRTSRKL